MCKYSGELTSPSPAVVYVTGGLGRDRGRVLGAAEPINGRKRELPPRTEYRNEEKQSTTAISLQNSREGVRPANACKSEREQGTGGIPQLCTAGSLTAGVKEYIR